MPVATTLPEAVPARDRWTGGWHPVVPAIVGAGCISSSAILVQLAHVGAGTTAFWRCALAVPGLVALSLWEERKYGRRRWRNRTGAAVAGAFLGVDLVLWTHAIYDVGAGVATVVGNLQVLFVALIAWAAFGERPQARVVLALPVVVAGLVLVTGLLGHPRFGGHPLAGVVYGIATSIAYAVFLVVLRRNTGGAAHVATPLAEATVGATAAALLLGLAWGQMSFTLPWGSLGWLALLALASQTLGWLFITSALPHLPAALTSLLLLLQPAVAMVLADMVLSQQPTLPQIIGAVLVCAGILWAAGAQPGRVERASAAPV